MSLEPSFPASPPPEVLDEIGAAADRADALAAADRELHFSVDDERGRVVVTVRDLAGNVIRTIPPSEALDVMAGASL
jgi:flagellar protein FlaG